MRGTALAALSTLLTAVGHLAGGGTVPALGLLLVLFPLLAGVFVTIAERCRGARGTIVTLAAGQLALHAVLVVLHPAHEVLAPAITSGAGMAAMHAAVTLVSAVAHPITSVRTTPMPGPTATTAKVPLDPPVQSHGRTLTETVGSVTWTAAPGTRIEPGQYLDFPLSLGRLPDIDVLVLPATQTYDDGEVVAWNEPPAADGAAPEHPAPAVRLTAAEGEPRQAAGPDPAARWLGGAGLLVGALGLGVSGGSLLRTRANRKDS